MKVTLLMDTNVSALHTLLPQTEWRESRVQCIKRLHNSDSPLAIRQNSQHMHCICSTQASVHTEHALVRTAQSPARVML